MDCDSCGRYRPSAEIVPLRRPEGRFVMACARCRRLATDRPRAAPPARVTSSAPRVIVESATALAPSR